MSNRTVKSQITKYAKEVLGFDLVGFSPAKIEDKYLSAFDQWLKDGNHADMHYMEKIDKRRDLTKILPGAKSVIVLALNYYQPQPEEPPEGHGTVARYAYGRDYHKIIGKKLKKLEKFIATIAPEAETKSYVDTGPLLERALAEQAGIGRLGKNGCLITEQFGSWVFLSEIITTLRLDLRSDSERMPRSTPLPEQKLTVWNNPKGKSFNACGGCTRCIDACPTGAIIAPGIIDSRLCISYLTIENRDKIPPKLAKIIAKTKRLYGCDICQEVCPHNQKRQRSIPSQSPLKNPKIAGPSLSLKKIAALKTDADYLQTFAGSPLMRAKRPGLQRNADIFVDKSLKK